MAYQNQKVKPRQTVTTSQQTQPLGVVANVPMGEWNASTEYLKLNTVRSHGATYQAKKNNQGVEPTVTQGWLEVWQLIAQDYIPAMPTISFVSGRTYNGDETLSNTNPVILTVKVLDGELKKGDELTLLQPKLSTRTPEGEFHDRRYRLGVIAQRFISNEELTLKNISLGVAHDPIQVPTEVQNIMATHSNPSRIGRSNGLCFLRIRRKFVNPTTNVEFYKFSNLVPILIRQILRKGVNLYNFRPL